MLLIIVTNIHEKNELWCDFFKNLCLVHYIFADFNKTDVFSSRNIDLTGLETRIRGVIHMLQPA